MVVDGVDDVLMGSFICIDEAEIISGWKSDKLLVFQSVSKPFLFHFQCLEYGIKHHEEDNRAQGATLENSSLDSKGFKFELGSPDI